MRLSNVPAATGITWMRLAVRTFVRQPLAFIGLFFLYLVAVSMLSLIPLVGDLVAMLVVPCIMLGLMAASREVHDGRFAKPSLLIMAVRPGAAQARAFWVLGALYAALVALVYGVAPSFPPEAAKTGITPEMMAAMLSDPRLLVALLLAVPVLMMFWHAPALVHWHGISPVKSLFFSVLACWRNRGALTVYVMTWMGISALAGIVVSVLSALLGSAQAMGMLVFPVGLLLATVFHVGIYFSFRDSFDDGDQPRSSDDTPHP
jgi:hypothetical protein